MDSQEWVILGIIVTSLFLFLHKQNKLTFYVFIYFAVWFVVQSVMEGYNLYTKYPPLYVGIIYDLCFIIYLSHDRELCSRIVTAVLIGFSGVYGLSAMVSIYWLNNYTLSDNLFVTSVVISVGLLFEGWISGRTLRDGNANNIVSSSVKNDTTDNPGYK